MWCCVRHPYIYIGPSHVVDSQLNTKNQSVWSVLHVKEWRCKVQVYWDKITDQPIKVNYLHTSSSSSPTCTDWITLHKENAAFCFGWVDMNSHERFASECKTCSCDSDRYDWFTIHNLYPPFTCVLNWQCASLNMGFYVVVFWGGGGGVCVFNHVLWQNVFHPDITVMVDWTLKTSYLPFCLTTVKL